MPESEVESFSSVICKSLDSFDFFCEAELVALYMPIKNEVDVLPLFKKTGRHFLFPRVEQDSKKLAFYEAESFDDFEPGAYGIREPKLSLPKIEIEKIDLFVVPGVAFSEKCERIGYGGGYYDTTLKFKNKRAHSVGVAFDFQIVEPGFSGPFDVRLDAVLTERRHFII